MKTEYKGYTIETLNLNTDKEQSVIYDSKGNPVKGTHTDINKNNSIEKAKVKIDNLK